MDAEYRARVEKLLAVVEPWKRQQRLQMVRSGKVTPRGAAERAEWGKDVHDPAPTLRKITKMTNQMPAAVSSWGHPNGEDRVWWIDGVAYTDDPRVISACARKRCLIEDAPDGPPAEYVKRAEEARRRRAEDERRRAERAVRGDARERQKGTPPVPS